MTDLTSLGYPPGFHMGFSAILWWTFIVLILILGLMLYLNARKSDLINVKEMFRAKSFLYICYGICYSLIQVGVFFPNNFKQFYFLGNSILCISGFIYYYYWEKNLTSIKRIPTISIGANTILTIIALIISLFFPNLLSLANFLVLIALSLATIAFILYIYLIFVFSKNVKGISTGVSAIWIIGMVINIIGLGIENSTGVTSWTLPLFIVLYVSPILFMVGLSLVVYGVTKLFAQISSYYVNTQKCAVHRGTIEKGSTIYYCPSCGITYCESCFNQVIINDGCWNCRKGAEPEVEKEWKGEQVIKSKTAGKHPEKKIQHKKP